MKLKNIMQGLKDFFNSLAEGHGPYDPAPEVMQKLEAKGYRFEFQTIVAPMAGIPVRACSVTDAQGRNISIAPETRKAYHEAYEQAVKECAPPAPGPK